MSEVLWYPSKWGTDDEIGALRAITPAKIIEAAGLVKLGKTYNLAHVLEEGIPSLSFHWPVSVYHFSPPQSRFEIPRKNE